MSVLQQPICQLPAILPRALTMRVVSLLLLVLIVNTCDAGNLLGMSYSNAGSESRAQTGQSRLQTENDAVATGRASSGGSASDAPMIGKPMLGKSGARPWNMPSVSGPSAGASMRSTYSQVPTPATKTASEVLGAHTLIMNFCVFCAHSRLCSPRVNC